MDDLEGPFEKPAVVLDLGSYALKAGFACDNHPLTRFRTLLSRPKGLSGRFGYGKGINYEVLVGDYAHEAALAGKDLDLNVPIVQGEIVHWDNMERLLFYVFYNELKVAPEDRGLMMVCPTLMEFHQKLKFCEVVFEVLNCPAICIQPSGILCQYGSGLSTGITVDIGYDSVSVDPVYCGILLRYAHVTTGFAGRDITRFINDYLVERNIHFGYEGIDRIEDIIRDHVYVTMDSAVKLKEYKKTYVTPKGERIDVSNESFMAGECLFQPELVMPTRAKQFQFPVMGLQDAIVEVLNRLDRELRREVSKGIVMSGGLSKIKGLNDRLDQELTDKTKRITKVIRSNESEVLPWMGGAILAGIKESQDIWVTKELFEEQGAKVVSNRFL